MAAPEVGSASLFRIKSSWPGAASPFIKKGKKNGFGVVTEGNVLYHGEGTQYLTADFGRLMSISTPLTENIKKYKKKRVSQAKPFSPGNIMCVSD